jgi:hypothetical protein
MTNSGPRRNERMFNDVTKTYDTALYSNDQGLWTVYEIVKRPIAKVAHEGAALDLIKRLELADKAKGASE